MKPGETILPAASMTRSAAGLSAPTDLIVSPSISTEPLGIISWPAPDQPTTVPPSMRMLIANNPSWFEFSAPGDWLLFALEKLPVPAVTKNREQATSFGQEVASPLKFNPLQID